MEILRFIESIRLPFFDVLFSLITRLGESAVTIVVIIPIFWCINKKLGYKLIYSALYSLGINQFLKILVKRPRPWVEDKTFKPVKGAKGAATGYSFPSGHTANAAVLFGNLLIAFKKAWVKALFAVVILLIAFSRLYLGVHFLSDVLVSLVITAMLVIVVSKALDLAENNNLSEIILNIGLIALATALLIYCRYSSNGEPEAQTALKTAYTFIGVATAVVVSRFIDKHYTHFSVKAPLPVQVCKVVAGAALTLLIRLGLKYGFEALGLSGYILDSFRYFAVAFFAVGVWPATFKFWVKLYNKLKS